MKSLNFFGTQTVRQASLILILVSICAKLAGFFRETVTARKFGISADYDLFLIIFIIPASISVTVNYAISYALTPFYQKISIDRGPVFARCFAMHIFLYGMLFFVFCSVVTMAFAGQMVSLLTFDDSGYNHGLAVQLLLVLIWLLPLYFGVAVLQTVLQAEHFFFAPSISPMIQNVVVITVLLVFGHIGVIALAYAWCAGLFLWFSWLFFTYCYTQGRESVTLFAGSDEISNALFPAFVLSAFQIACIEIWPQLYIFFDRIAAQIFRLVEGSIAALGYATTLYTMVLSVIALSVGKAIFPFLSTQVAQGNKKEQIKLLSTGVRWMILISLPVTSGLFALSDEVVQLVYQRGDFDALATVATSAALKIYCIGLPFDTAYAILVGYYYSLQDYRSLVIVALSSIVIKIIVGVCLINFFGYLGLAVSTVVALICRAALMTMMLKCHNMLFVQDSEIRIFIGKTLLSVLPGTLLAFYGVSLLSPLFHSIIEIPALTNLAIIIIVFSLVFVSYGCMLIIVRVPEGVVLVEKMRRVKDHSA